MLVCRYLRTKLLSSMIKARSTSFVLPSLSDLNRARDRVVQTAEFLVFCLPFAFHIPLLKSVSVSDNRNSKLLGTRHFILIRPIPCTNKRNKERDVLRKKMGKGVGLLSRFYCFFQYFLFISFM